jgi:DNA adenine methylase
MITKTAKPFVKWVGGKTQLLPHLTKIVDTIYPNKQIDSYVEPFIGGGALFFWLCTHKHVKSAIISDVNEDLILTYRVVQQFTKKLINQLALLEQQYVAVNDEQREVMYYEIRKQYNLEKTQINYEKLVTNLSVNRASKFIFLNKTCFNGLYRQNSKGQFNVPFGRYKTPKICDADNLINCAAVLKNVNILCGDFKSTEKYVVKNSLVYLDPPYKPITKTASFTKYHKDDFGDNDQIRLADYYKRIDGLGAKIILSNSDPMSVNSNNSFFDDLYSSFDISRVNVSRAVSAAASSRKVVKELIIKNIGLGLI